MVAVVAVVLSAQGQAPKDASQPAQRVVVKAARLLDVRKGSYVENAAVLIEGERIVEAGTAAQVEAHAGTGAKVIDLGGETLLPGLIDCHTHLMARFANTNDGYLLGLATKSQAFRALEGAADARVTLEAGFTTVRDVESEGSEYADVALRDAIDQDLVPGPRMQVATRAIAAVGQYNPFGVSADLTDFPTGAQNGERRGRGTARGAGTDWAWGECAEGVCGLGVSDADGGGDAGGGGRGAQGGGSRWRRMRIRPRASRTRSMRAWIRLSMGTTRIRRRSS